MKEKLFDNNLRQSRVRFPDFMKYIDEQSLFDYAKAEFKNSLELFDQDRNGQADIEDIKRVLKTYSTLEEEEVNHFVRMSLQGEDEEPKGININDTVKKMFSV